VTIDSVYQPVLAFHGKSRDAVRGKNQLFENVALYENAFGKTKARHILFAYALSRAIDRIRLRLKAEEAEKGELIKLDDKQLRLLRNLNFKPFLIDVVARLLESICGHKMDVTTVAFKPEIAKKSLTELEELWSPVVDAVLPIVSVRVEPETFFRLHSDAGDTFIVGMAERPQNDVIEHVVAPGEERPNLFRRMRQVDPSYWSRKERIFLERDGCFSFLSAFASICRMRSRVTLNCWPTSSSV